MKRVVSLFLLSALGLVAQRAETITFRGTMSPANEIPAIDINAAGNATLRAHVVRNAAGEVISGSVDFIVSYAFPGAVEFSGLHIHRGDSTVNGPVVINTGIGGAAGTLPSDPSGRGLINRQAQVRPNDATALAALRDLLVNPAGFYVNLHTTVNPGGVIRSQLQKAEVVTYMTHLSTANEVPPITGQNASGILVITAMRTFNTAGVMDSAQVLFEANYDVGRATNLVGFHIHQGFAGFNAPVVVNTGLANFPTPETGRGTLTYPVEVNVTTAANQTTINRLFVEPAAFYGNIHTTEFPGGIIRGQLRPVDQNTFSVLMSPANEVPPLTIDAQAPAVVTVNSLRNSAGEITAARVLFDVNYRFPSDTTFTGLHIHNQVAGQNGPVIVNTGLTGTNTLVTDGFGNISIPVLVSDAAGLATVNSMMSTPDRHYVNLHSTVNPGGVVRAQVATQLTQPPVITEAGSAADPSLKTVAPGEWISIYGLRFAQVRTDYWAFDGTSLPTTLNGVSVTIGGRAAPIFTVAPGWIDVQVPYETPAGAQAIVVKNEVGSSGSLTITVAERAPAIWRMGTDGGQVVRVSDFSFVDAESPAAVGELLAVVVTGLGQTTPPLATGAYINDVIYGVTGVTVNVGSRVAPVLLAGAYPGLPSTYVVAFTVPPGTPSGPQTFDITMGGQRSNRVMLPIR